VDGEQRRLAAEVTRVVAAEQQVARQPQVEVAAEAAHRQPDR
jgi:hypothetical protein